MDAESQNAAKFLQSIAQVHKAFEELKSRLEKQSEVKEAIVWYFKPKFFETNNESNSGFGLAVELHDTTLIDWWLELSWSHRWLLEHNVYKSAAHEHGNHTEIAFPDVECTTLDEVVYQLSQATQELLATADEEYPFIK
jgi:hypothetical protein